MGNFVKSDSEMVAIHIMKRPILQGREQSALRLARFISKRILGLKSIEFRSRSHRRVVFVLACIREIENVSNVFARNFSRNFARATFFSLLGPHNLLTSVAVAFFYLRKIIFLLSQKMAFLQFFSPVQRTKTNLN